MRAFELETIDGFERYSTTSKCYAVLKVQYFEALATRSARIMQILKTTRVSNYNLDVMVICLAENINEHYKQSWGLRRCRCRLATRAMYSGLGKHGQGTSFRSSRRTSSTMADAGLKISTAALALTFAVMLAANVAPTSAA